MSRGLVLGAVIGIFLAGSCVAAEEKVNTAPPSTGPLDGTWEGVVKLEKTAWAEAREEKTRVVVAGPNVRVYVEEKGAFAEIKPSKFQISYLNNNAVIWGSNKGIGMDSDWTDTTVYAVAIRGDGKLLVEYTNIGNTTNELNWSISTGARRGEGEFERTASR